MATENTISIFLERVQGTPRLWHSVDQRVVAVRVGESWVNLITRVQLDVRPPHAVPRFQNLPEIDLLFAHQTVAPAGELGAILGRTVEGQAQVGGRDVSYLSTGSDTQDPTAYWSPSTNFADRASVYARDRRQWSDLSLSAAGSRIQDLVKHLPGGVGELDRRLRTLPHPFDGLTGLARIFAGADDRYGADRSASYTVVAPYPARLDRDRSGFRDTLRVGIRAATREVGGACDLAYSAVGADGIPVSGPIPLPPDLWVEEDDGSWVVHGEFPPPPARAATVFLRLGGMCVDRLELANLVPRGRNIALDAYRSVDPDLEYFLAGLAAGGRPNANGFEQAVGRLFTFLGFRVDAMGQDKRLSDSVDCIAYADREGAILPVECTTGSIDAGGKLGKLVVRAQTLRRLLPGHAVQPVLATQQSREAISRQEMSRAGADRVAVLAAEDLDDLVQRSLSATPVSEVLGAIAAAVPEQDEGAAARLLYRR